MKCLPFLATGSIANRSAAVLALTALTTLFAGCKQEPKNEPGPARPPLPALTLHPMLEELQSLAATLQAPDDKTQKVLRDYADISLRLVETDPRTERMVVQSLLEHKDAWYVLEPALVHDDAGVRQRAAWLCGQSGQAILQLPLLLRLKYELDPAGLIWVADALLKLGNDSALVYLPPAFNREQTANQAGQVAIAALNARGVTVPDSPSWEDLTKLLQELSDKWRATGVSAHQATVPIDQQQLTARLAHHLQTPEGTQLRPVDDARFVLTRLGTLAVPMIAKTLQAEEHYLRSMPLQVLANLGTAAKSAADAIMPLLGDPLTAMYAVHALSEIGVTETIPHLRPLLDDRDTELRREACQALGLLGDTESKPRLEQRLQDEQETMDVRVAAAFGLLCLGEHPAALAYLNEREANKDYHEPTLTRLRERLASRGQ